jgi:hypothetical protein
VGPGVARAGAQNFLVVLLGAEYDPDGTGGTELGRLQEPLNVAFTSLFTAELLLSLYARWLSEFLRLPPSPPQRPLALPPPQVPLSFKTSGH